MMNLIKIFDGSFGGPTLYENPHYVPPNMVSTAIEVIGLGGRLVLLSCYSHLLFNFIAGPNAVSVSTCLCV